jgi:hypothetical protein
MDRKIVLIVALLTLAAPAAWAQYQAVVEISGLAGYTWSDGVSYDTGGKYTKLEPADAFNWGFTAGYRLPYGTEIEFLYDLQATDLNAVGLSGHKTIGSMNVSNYHGLLIYNFVQRDSPVIPYIFGGMGATSFGDVTYTNLEGRKQTATGDSKFSTTWGGGLKIYAPDKPYGLKLQFRWTPTYIKTDATGYWCDPYWGCYTTGDSQYSNQVQLAAGLTFRFPVGK